MLDIIALIAMINCLRPMIFRGQGDADQAGMSGLSCQQLNKAPRAAVSWHVCARGLPTHESLGALFLKYKCLDVG